MDMCSDEEENCISLSESLSNEGIFENMGDSFQHNQSNDWMWYPVLVCGILELVILLVAVISGYSSFELFVLFWATCLFPLMDAYLCWSSFHPVKPFLSAMHMIFFIEVLYAFHMWNYEYKIMFVVTIECLKIFITGDCIFPATICTISTVQCWSHNDLSTIATVFAYAFLTLTLCFHRILYRLQIRLQRNVKKLLLAKKHIQLQKRAVNEIIENSLGWKCWIVHSLNHSESMNSGGKDFPGHHEPSRATRSSYERSQSRSVSSCSFPLENITRKPAAPCEGQSKTIIEACENIDLLSSKSDIDGLIQSAMSYRRIRRKECTLLAIKPILRGAADCHAISYLQHGQPWKSLRDVAEFHNVVIVRRFGDVWIGCVGLFDDRPKEENARNVLQMACDVIKIGAEHHVQFTCAIDTGRVVGGFLNGIFNFDMLGPEILWVLSVCEAYVHNKVVVSRSSRKLLAKVSNAVEFENCLIFLPDRKDPEKAVTVADVDSCQVAVSFTDEVLPRYHVLGQQQLESEQKTGSRIFPWHRFTQTMGMATASAKDTGQHGLSHVTEPREDFNMDQWQQHRAPQFITDIRKLFSTVNPNVEQWERVDDNINTDSEEYNDPLNEAYLLSLLHRLMCHKVLVDSWFLLRIPPYFRVSVSADSGGAIPGCECAEHNYMLWDPPLLYYEQIMAAVRLVVFYCGYIQRSMWACMVYLGNRCAVRMSRHSARYQVHCDDNRENIMLTGDCTVTSGAATVESKDKPVPDRNEGHVSHNETPKAMNTRDYVPTSLSTSSDCAGLEFSPSHSWENYRRSCHSVYMHAGDVILTLFVAGIGLFALISYQAECTPEIPTTFYYPVVLSIASSLWSVVIFEHRDIPLLVFMIISTMRASSFVAFVVIRKHCSADNGTLALLLGFIGWIFVSFSRRVVYFIGDVYLVVIAMCLYMYLAGGYDHHLMETIGTIAVALLIVAGFYWASEYSTCVGFLMEHILIPEEQKIREHHQKSCLVVLQKFVPQLNGPLSIELFSPRCYNKCAILAFHIKAAETIPAVVDVPDVSSLIAFLYRFMDECVVKFGLISVCQFSGVHISAVCDDYQRLAASKPASSNYIQKTVDCVRYMQKKLTQFNIQNNMNMTLGVSLSHGPATIGLLGDVDTLRYDITGTARDQALYMCLKQNNSVVVSAAFQDEINRLHEISDSTYSLVTSRLPFGRSSQYQWFNLALNGGSFGASSRQLDDYIYEGFLGQGGNGSVHLLCDRVNRVKVAIKGIEWHMGRTASIPHIRRELVILQQLQHPNVVHFKFCIIKRAKIYIVMEYIRGGTLRQIVDQHKPSNEDLRVWFAQLVLALEYLHHQGIMHRDVKPSNCMVDTFGHLKLTDFGLALKEETDSHSVEFLPVLEDSDVTPSDEIITSHPPKHLQLSWASEQLIQNMFPIRENHDFNSAGRLKGNILVLDSDKVRQQSNATVLRQSFIVWSANNDDEAIDLVDTQQVDLVILNLDIQEDAMSGWGFLSVLWSDEKGKNIPVIVLTLSSDLTMGTRYWQKRLPGISTRPKQIFLHSIDIGAHQNYFAMLCNGKESNPMRSSNEDPRKAIHATVFDNMFDRVYRQRTLHAQVQRSSLRVTVPSRRLIRATGLVGTMQYMSPEMLAREPYFEIVDWWSCGVLFFECITRRRLFEGDGNIEIAKRIMQSDIGEILSAHRASLGAPMSDLLMHMLDRNVTTRYDSRLIKRHEYFNGSQSVEPYMVGRRFPPAAVDQSRVRSDKPGDSTLPSTKNMSFRDLCSQSSEYRPQPVPLDKLTEELKLTLKQAFYSSDTTKRSRSSGSTRIRSNSKKENSKSFYSVVMPTVDEEADAMDAQSDDSADNDIAAYDVGETFT